MLISNIEPSTLNEECVLFNFRWTRQHINELHEMADERGTTASAIIKDLIIRELKDEEKYWNTICV